MKWRRPCLDPRRRVKAGAGDDAGNGDAGKVLDAEARAAYKRRLAELDEKVREAEA